MTRDFVHVEGLTEPRMFGGFGYLLHGNMRFGIHKNTFMIRLGVDYAEFLMRENHVRPVDLTGRVMKGWATVEPAAMEEDEDLARFCGHAIAFVQGLPPKKN